MKKLKLYIIALFGLSLFFTSCEDQVDIRPSSIIIGDEATFTTLERNRQLLNGAYATMFNNVSVGDLGADNNQLAPTNTGQGVFTHNWQYTQSMPINYWTGNYSGMRDLNVVLSALGTIETNVASEEEFRDQLIAEALALRAYLHFQLAQGYSPRFDSSSEFGVPLSLAPVEASQEPPRASMTDTFAQIRLDLTTAINTFPSNAVNELHFFSRGACHALLSNVALWEGDWNGAMMNANLALSISGEDISSRTEMPLVWRDASTAGVIMEILRGNTAFESTFNRVTNPDVFYLAAQELIDLYSADDVRSEFYFDSDQVVTKYPTNTTQTAINIKLFRAAMMHLNIAEAAANTGNLGEAAAQINLINANRLANPTTVTFANSTEAIAAVEDARRMELAFEGDRFFQLKRLGLGVDRNMIDCQTVDCNLAANSFLFTLPIPEQEILANPNVLQFPGY